MDGTLRERLQPHFQPPASGLARERLAEVEPAFPAGFLTPPLRTLLLGLADHSEFLWGIVARAPERFVALVEQAPELGRRLVSRRSGTARSGRRASSATPPA